MIRRLATSHMSQMQILLDLLFNPKPQWSYLEDMRADVKDSQMQFASVCQDCVIDFTHLEVPNEDDICGKIAKMKYWFSKMQ